MLQHDESAHVAVVGCPFTTPVDLAHSRAPSSNAPDIVRSQSLRLVGALDPYDFCLGPSSPVTPFDGDAEAGVQAFNSANTEALLAP